MATQIRTGQKVLFIGDSITDCGRREVQRPLGNGYVKLFMDMLVAREPAKRITVVNKGIGGDTAVGLRNRWSDDVLRQRPDWLSIKIGINDLHRFLDNAREASLSPEGYEKVYHEILERTRAALPSCRILIIDPFYISRDSAPFSRRKSVLGLLPAYLAVTRKLARAYKTRHIQTHTVFGKLLRYYEPDIFCPEPVHPNPTGHLVIAEAVYNALS